MWWLILLLSSAVYAQSDIDLSSIQKLDDALPDYEEVKHADDEININRQSRRYSPPNKVISLEKIKNSGTQVISVSGGIPLQNLKDYKKYSLTRSLYLKVFNLEDEYGYKYILSHDGSVTWRILSRHAEPIKQELVLYEPPDRYTPAPKNIVHAEYDKKLTIPPEFSFYAGLVKGDYMADLFNDAKASNGVSNQYGIHFFTNWKLPIKAGAVLHYEKATYNLSNGNKVNYSSISIGPQFKTRDLEIFGGPIRFQTQFRVSPLARASADTVTGAQNFKFNSADLMASVEKPIKNSWGEFVLGLYVQTQWLSLKDQPNNLSIKASNQSNKSFGLSFAQVFQ